MHSTTTRTVGSTHARSTGVRHQARPAELDSACGTHARSTVRGHEPDSEELHSLLKETRWPDPELNVSSPPNSTWPGNHRPTEYSQPFASESPEALPILSKAAFADRVARPLQHQSTDFKFTCGMEPPTPSSLDITGFCGSPVHPSRSDIQVSHRGASRNLLGALEAAEQPAGAKLIVS